MGFWDSEVIEKAEEKQGFDVVPEGTYRVLLTDAEIKQTKAGGHYVNAKFELNGNEQLDGRILFAKFNVDNANSQAVSIGLGQIKEFATACNNVAFYDSLKLAEDWPDASNKLNGMFDALGNIPIEVKVSVKQDEKYGPQNDIKRFKAVSGSSVPSAAKSSAAKPAAKNSRPW